MGAFNYPKMPETPSAAFSFEIIIAWVLPGFIAALCIFLLADRPQKRWVRLMFIQNGPSLVTAILILSCALGVFLGFTRIVALRPLTRFAESISLTKDQSDKAAEQRGNDYRARSLLKNPVANSAYKTYQSEFLTPYKAFGSLIMLGVFVIIYRLWKKFRIISSEIRIPDRKEARSFSGKANPWWHARAMKWNWGIIITGVGRFMRNFGIDILIIVGIYFIWTRICFKAIQNFNKSAEAAVAYEKMMEGKDDEKEQERILKLKSLIRESVELLKTLDNDPKSRGGRQ